MPQVTVWRWGLLPCFLDEKEDQGQRSYTPSKTQNEMQSRERLMLNPSHLTRNAEYLLPAPAKFSTCDTGTKLGAPGGLLLGRCVGGPGAQWPHTLPVPTVCPSVRVLAHGDPRVLPPSACCSAPDNATASRGLPPLLRRICVPSCPPNTYRSRAGAA